MRQCMSQNGCLCKCCLEGDGMDYRGLRVMSQSGVEWRGVRGVTFIVEDCVASRVIVH